MAAPHSTRVTRRIRWQTSTISVNGRRRHLNAGQSTRATRELGDPAGEAGQRAQAIAHDIYGRSEYGSLGAILTTIRGLVAG